MRVRPDGSVQSSGTPTPDNTYQTEDFSLYRCVIDKVIYVDDPRNITGNSSNPRVLYDAIVLGGFKSGQVLTNIRLSSELGGESGFYERTLRACTRDISKTRLSDSDGDIVLVQFIQGNIAFPMIVALDNGIHTSDKIGAKLSDGPRSLRQYNGVSEEIDNSGQWTQKVRSGTANPEKGRFDAAAVPLVTTSVTKDEKVTRTFKSGLTMTEDGSADKITTSFKTGLIVTEDGTADKISMSFKNGLQIVEDGAADKFTLVTAGGLTITFDGKNDDLLVKTAAGAELHLKTGKVALGASGIEILDKLSMVADLIGQWATNVGAVHSHIDSLGYASGAPDNFLQWEQLGTDEEAVKTDVDSIKGTLA